MTTPYPPHLYCCKTNSICARWGNTRVPGETGGIPTLDEPQFPMEGIEMNTDLFKHLRTKLFVLAVIGLMAATTLAQTAYACQSPIGGC